ncbi:MAG TPA: NAD(P)-dependent oxidoreductase [Chloroflexota bacterium]|jgi:3-hydroxyisobutyrate dehydrogenase|nr:NAD(P)-dependent oxidoreductase [Chloroflexota bacterium]
MADLRVGFIGIGVMGRPMSLNLRKAGFPVTVYSRRRETAEPVLAAGATWADSPRAVAEASDIVITMVTSSPDVQQVVLGANGVLEGAHQGMIIADMSTIAPVVAQNAAATAAERGVPMLDAPVSGGSQGAEAGTLTIMAGGDRAVFDHCRPVFEAMGKHENIFYVGPSGTGQVVKLINQHLCGVIAAADAEAFILGVKAGADVATMARIIGASSGGNWQLANPIALRAFTGTFEPGFFTDLLLKDLNLVLELAEQYEVDTPLARMSRAMYERAVEAGLGRRDYTSVFLELEKEAGVQVRLSNGNTDGADGADNA